MRASWFGIWQSGPRPTERPEYRQPSVCAKYVSTLVDDPFVAQMKMGELAGALLQVELDGAGGPGRAAADLGDAVLKAVRKVDPGDAQPR